MHWESGLPRDLKTLANFWGRVFDGINKSGRKIKIYERAKGLPDTVINVSLNKKIDFTIQTKYSAEQMGMPFHPAHIQVQNQFDRRHGYADLLTYPKRYDMLYRLWNGGSQKLLLWGDAEYVRRFVRSSKLYNSNGIFEFMEIEGAKPMRNGLRRTLTASHVYTEYDFQRYWCQNLMFGRLGYNPNTPEVVFLREFNRRFGEEAGPVIMDALTKASKIIPRIISSAMPDFQEQRGVPEWGSGSGLNGKGMLSAYAKIKPLDKQTFISFEEAAQYLIQKKESGRVWPQQNSEWFAKTAFEINKLIKKANEKIGIYKNKEYESTITDIKILAAMAKFHAERIKAAIAYNLYLKLNKNSLALDSAINYEKKAIEIYRTAVDVAGDYYPTDLDISVSDTGHWIDELGLMEKAFVELKKSPINNSFPVPAINVKKFYKYSSIKIFHDPLKIVEPNKPVTIKFKAEVPSGIKWARLLFRGVTQFQDYEMLDMKYNGEYYSATISPEKTNKVIEYHSDTGAIWDFMYIIEVVSNEGIGFTYPNFEKSDPYIFVKVPHKTLEETNGKIAISRLADKTYKSGSDDSQLFKIINPIEGDEFQAGSDIKVILFSVSKDPNQKVELYVNGALLKKGEPGEFEFTIKGLSNGSYRLMLSS